MLQEIEIPREVPVMTLSSTVLFPQAVMPLYIFEPRYRTMLKEVLAADRIFAIATLDESDETTRNNEIPHAVASVGMIRACRKNADGTSNLILQGLARVAFEEIVTEQPYRKARIKQLVSEPGGSPEELEHCRSEMMDLIRTQIRLGAPIPNEVLQFLKNISEPEGVLDLAIYTLCSSGELKQQLLEEGTVLDRFKKFAIYLRGEIERIKIERKLKGGLEDDDLGNN